MKRTSNRLSVCFYAETPQLKVVSFIIRKFTEIFVFQVVLDLWQVMVFCDLDIHAIPPVHKLIYSSQEP